MAVQNLPPAVSAEFETRFHQPPGAEPANREVLRWQQVCKDLVEERERLRKELAEAERDKKRYLRAIHDLMEETGADFTKEEVMALVGQSPSIDELIENLR